MSHKRANYSKAEHKIVHDIETNTVTTLEEIQFRTGVSMSTIYRAIKRGVIEKSGTTYGDDYTPMYQESRS